MKKNEEDELGYLNLNSRIYRTRLSRKFTGRKPYKPADPKMVVSFIPGTVLDILVKEGQSVSKGDDLLILDAMKMQNMLKCQFDGKVKRIHVEKGARVSKGTLLMEME
jgi:biotin carboxyl carrier protein